MDPARPYLVQAAASAVLRRQGIAALWPLQLLAAELHGEGHALSAQVVLDIADEAEWEWAGRWPVAPQPRQ